MKTFKLIAGSAVCMVWLSCGGEKKEGKDAESLLQSVTENVDPNAKGGNTCLLAYSDKLDELLTLEMASELSGLPADAAEKDYSRVMKNPEYHSCGYGWKGKRVKKIEISKRHTIDAPIKDMVKIEGLKPVSLEYFKKSRTAPTDKDLADMDKTIDNALDKETGNKKLEDAKDKLDELGVSKETQKNVAGQMGGMFKEIAKAYSDVSGLGDAAAWNSIEKRLYVLDDGVELSVSVDLSDDAEADKGKAIELARKLLAKCQ